LTVQNTGDRRGATVPQLYLISAAGAPLRRLVAFKRVELAPGERRSIEVAVDPRLLARWDVKHHRWWITQGAYVFALGDSATNLGKPGQVQLREGGL
jgi:beta-glucosidase